MTSACFSLVFPPIRSFDMSCKGFGFHRIQDGSAV